MIDLFIKLIEKSIQLIHVRKDQDKSLLVDFVSPTYFEFRKLHEQYLSNFDEYMRCVEEHGKSREGIDHLIDKLYKDNLYTAHQRKELESLCEILNKIKNYDEIVRFVKALLRYITTQTSVSYSDTDSIRRLDNFPGQVWRNSLKESLEKVISEPEKYSGQWQEEIIHRINDIVLNMQQAAHGVTSSYLLLKSKLL